MKRSKIKVSAFILTVFLFTVVLFSGTQASFLDIIRALVTINPLELDVSVPAEAEVNKVFKVEAVATNKGEDTIESAKAEIFLPVGLVLLQKDSMQNMGVIRGKRDKKVSWSVKGDNVGDYIISVLVSGELGGNTVRADGTVKVTLKEKSSPPGRPFTIFQRLLNTFQRWLRL